MTKLEKLEQEIASLPPEDIKALAHWLDELRQRLWDDEISAGSPGLDQLAADALSDWRDGLTTPLNNRQ
jgi:hypothetical protein